MAAAHDPAPAYSDVLSQLFLAFYRVFVSGFVFCRLSASFFKNYVPRPLVFNMFSASSLLSLLRV